MPMEDQSGTSSTRDETPLPPGATVPQSSAGEPRPVIPGYEILEELGRGGMGVVYKARQLNLGRIVALKVIRRDRLAHPDTVRRFRREVQAVARLSHPHLVVVHHADQLGETHYFAMEYVDGVTLQRLVQDEGPLPVVTACEYIRQAAVGLQHAHERRLVHRDIKPANLMIVRIPESTESSPKGRFQLKILDLGMAKLMQPLETEESVNSTLTEAGAVIGTLDYIAPEQARDPRTADIRADLYSLGCTFHYLLTGQVLFPGGAWLDKLLKHRTEEPPKIRDLRGDVPSSVSQIIERLLAKDPDDRFQTPAELAKALEPWCDPLSFAELSAREAVEPAGKSDQSNPPAATGRDLEALRVELEGHLRRGDFRRARDTVAAMLRINPGDLEALAARAVIDKYSGESNYVGEQRRLMGHSDAVTSVDFSLDGKRAASAGKDGALRVWDLDEGKSIWSVQAHLGGATCLRWLNEGTIVSAGLDRIIRVWDLVAGKELRALKGHSERIRAIAIDVGRALLLSASGSSGRKKDNSIRLWSLETFKELTRLQGHADQVNAVAFGTHADEVVSAGNDGTVRVWNSRTGKESLCISAAEGPITAIAITPDGRQVLCAGENVRLVDLPTEGDKCWIFHHPSPVTSLALSADGLRFISGCTDSIVRLWSMTSGRFGRQVEQHVLGVKTVVRVWEPGHGEKPHEYQGHVDHVTCLALSPDGHKVLSGSTDRTVRLWGLPPA